MAQIFVKLLDGRTQCLQISTPTISGLSLKQDLHKSTKIPLESIRLVSGTREISQETLISASSHDAIFPSLTLLLRLRGGKGGFGSLLRGAATKAGQKKKNNFDACRDMSGRRLRHVNAEKKLEEWKADAGERKFENIAEDFLKKKSKEANKNRSGDTDKYLQKYMEDSAQCVERVKATVRETFENYMNSKRKLLHGLGPASKSKRLKFWTENYSDTDEDEQSVLNNVKTDEGTSGSSSVGLSDGEYSGGSSLKGVSIEINGICNEKESSGGGSSKGVSAEINGICNENGLVVEDCGNGVIDTGDGSSLQPKHEVCNGGLEPEDCSVGVALNPAVEVELGMPHHDTEEIVEGTEPDASMNVGSPVEPKLKICAETVAPAASVTCLNGLLNFDKFNSTAELEVLGMERLKVELQSHGLKCGGTLQERATRLFWLKSTPLDKLPKKLLAKAPRVKSTYNCR